MIIINGIGMPATSSLDQELSPERVPGLKGLFFMANTRTWRPGKMRKNIKNNMITRILAIGLATAVFATSAPANVFADEEETVTVESSESSSDSSSDSSDSSSESSSDSSESVSCESEAPAVEAAPEVATEVAPEVAPEVAEAAAEESTVVAEILIIDNNIAPEAEAVAAAPEATVEGQEVAEAETPAAPEKSLVEIASESIDNLEDKTETVKSTEQKSSDEADSAVENAEVANTSKSKKEAYQAKDDAVADITAAEADLEKVNAAYEEAVVAKEQAEADVAAAEAEYNAAVEQLNEARRTASQNLTAAQAAFARNIDSIYPSAIPTGPIPSLKNTYTSATSMIPIAPNEYIPYFPFPIRRRKLNGKYIRVLRNPKAMTSFP